VALHVATVNPVTSGGGFVRGYNWQGVNGAESNHYSYEGKGLGLDVGASIQSVWAVGKGAWTGEFRSVNFSAAWFSFSYFWSPDSSWHGITYGLGVGLPIPQASYETTNITMHCSASEAVGAAAGGN
jgi:hypothetical protein